MGLRCSRFATGVLVVGAVVLLSSSSWAHWYDLGPSKDEWGVKYQGEVDAANGDQLNVRFTLADQGRLKPIHSVFVMALSTPDGRGSGTYVLKTPITMKPTADGQLTGQVAVKKEFANRAMIRIFTYTVDGRSQMAGPMGGARYYDIPLRKFLKKAPAAASSQSPAAVASPPASRVAKSCAAHRAIDLPARSRDGVLDNGAADITATRLPWRRAPLCGTDVRRFDPPEVCCPKPLPCSGLRRSGS